MIVITSRDFAILLLYRFLRHSHTEHELRTIFSSFQFLQKRSKLSDCSFWEFSYKRKFFFFLLISCTRNLHSTMIEDYIERNDVIRCELDCLALIEIESELHFLKFVVQTKKFLFDTFCVCEIDIQQWSKII